MGDPHLFSSVDTKSIIGAEKQMQTVNVLWKKVKGALTREELPAEFAHLKHEDPREHYAIQYNSIAPIRFTR